jgi:hypothetical protein
MRTPDTAIRGGRGRRLRGGAPLARRSCLRVALARPVRSAGVRGARAETGDRSVHERGGGADSGCAQSGREPAPARTEPKHSHDRGRAARHSAIVVDELQLAHALCAVQLRKAVQHPGLVEGQHDDSAIRHAAKTASLAPAEAAMTIVQESRHFLRPRERGPAANGRVLRLAETTATPSPRMLPTGPPRLPRRRELPSSLR